MILDVIFALAVILGFYHGYKKGIIYSLISLLGVFIASIAAMKLAFWASDKLKDMVNIPPILLPFVSMVLVFICVFLGLRLIGHLLEKFISSMSLSPLNQVSGGLLWCFVSLFVISAFIWLLDKGQILKPELKTSSITYPIISPIAPAVFDVLAYLLPIFKEWYEAVGKLFDQIGKKS
jgi:membrane protein required for colicin V production